MLKIKNFFSMKDTTDKGNRWETDWEKILAMSKLTRDQVNMCMSPATHQWVSRSPLFNEQRIRRRQMHRRGNCPG